MTMQLEAHAIQKALIEMSDSQTAVAVAEPEVEAPSTDEGYSTDKANQKTEPRRQPRYHVVLWNDEDHSFDYVVTMMKSLFGHPSSAGLEIAGKVDNQGRAVCLTTTMEHAELKRDQIHAFGRDKWHSPCQGSMSASIEPVPSN